MHLTLLLINVSVITNGKINYSSVLLAEAILLVIGAGLWVVGVDVWQGPSRARKIGGALLLLLAAGYSLAWVGLNYWEYTQLREYF